MFHIQECPPRFGVPGKSLHKRGVAVFAAMGTAHIRIDGIAAHRQGGFCHDIFGFYILKVGRIFFADISGHFHTFPLGKFHSGILSGTDKSAGFFRIWVTVWVRAEN